MRLWLVRHGETEANVAGLYSGHAPTPLTEKRDWPGENATYFIAPRAI